MEWKKIDIIPHTTKKEVPIILEESEDIVYSVDNASIYHRDVKTEHLNGYVLLTSLRVVWVSFNNSSKTASYALSLSHEPVIHIEPLQTGLMGLNSSPKILITLGNTTYRLSFHSGKRDECLSQYKLTLSKFKDNQRKKLASPPIHQYQHQHQTTDSPPSYQYHQQQHQPQNNYNPYSQQHQQYQHQQQQQQYYTQPQNNYNPYSQQQSYNNNNNQYYQQQQQQQQQYQQPLPPPPSYPGTTSPTNKTFNTGIYTPKTLGSNQQQQEGFTSNAGIGGILKQMNKKTQETDKLLNEAFTDLSALMDKAKDMVTLSQKLKLTLEKKDQEKSSSTSEEEEFRTFLLEMGIESPVTKKTAKSKYHQELAKELSNWIISKKILTKQESGVVGKVTSMQSGMISLPDLYCIFNRARGIELISPDDLYRACILFESLDLPFRIRKFDSGVLIIQSKDENDELVAIEILEIINNQGPISAFDLSKLQSISLNLAKDKLQASEKIGKLCRDETIEGIIFHSNIFV
ncbi:hypothetical protein CYY_004625 [Polysphondylium violaceum]|uniref:Vacuolar protein-sorting-associated protein 36 n=1 Tax=Polysphondylium violaceum TaxID=133409 RepID=A0A8J4USV7_9MYCE|nr:hypothetical protein CYY_004625 [Polysphondylium violaceum]